MAGAGARAGPSGRGQHGRAEAAQRLTQLTEGPLGPRAAWALAMDALSRRDTVTAERWRARIGSGSGTAAALAVLTDAVATAQRGQTDSALVRTAPLRLDSSGLVRAPFARAVL